LTRLRNAAQYSWLGCRSGCTGVGTGACHRHYCLPCAVLLRNPQRHPGYEEEDTCHMVSSTQDRQTHNTRTHTYTHTRTHTHTHTHTRIYTAIYTHIYPCTRTQTCTLTHLHTHIHTHTHTHTHSHTHTHTHTHTSGDFQHSPVTVPYKFPCTSNTIPHSFAQYSCPPLCVSLARAVAFPSSNPSTPSAPARPSPASSPASP
jgi:hypothetical protein